MLLQQFGCETVQPTRTLAFGNRCSEEEVELAAQENQFARKAGVASLTSGGQTGIRAFHE
jgi:hypothetical protein